MVNKCSVFGCFTNFEGHESGTVFVLHTLKDPEQKMIWFRFCNRSDLNINGGCLFICEKHFEEKFIKRNDMRPRLIKHLIPVPTIHPKGVYDDKPSCLPSTSQSRKLPKQRFIQQDQTLQYQNDFKINHFHEVDESLLAFLDGDYRIERYDDHVVFYKIIKDNLSIPSITECIRIDYDLHVQLFYKGSPIPLPNWFRKGSGCKLTYKDMLTNFSSYLHTSCEEHRCEILLELQKLNFRKSPVYSANLIRYSLLLRHSSLPAYKLLQEEFKLPSLTFLRKMTAGKIDAVKSAKCLLENGNISEDVILIFDEMFLQKSEEFAGGESIGADKNGELYNGVLCFMIVGLQSNVPFVIKALPEKQINGEWLREELLKCLSVLQENGFNVRGIVCDNHSNNVSAFKKILATHGQTSDDMYFTSLNGKKVYLFFDTVHLIKNIRNNLLNRKTFLFPEFHFDGFYDGVTVRGGEVSWNLFHKVYEKDQDLEAKLKASPKLSAKVLHPGNCKQNVSVALAIFDRSTSTRLLSREN